MNLIAEIWDGKLPLVKVYWLYGVAVGVFFAIFSLLIKDYPTALIVITVALIPYQILVFVGIWRSADAYRDKKIWAVLAKVHVVLGVIAALNGVATVIKIVSDNSSATTEINSTTIKPKLGSDWKWHQISGKWWIVDDSYETNKYGFVDVWLKIEIMEVAKKEGENYSHTIVNAVFSCNDKNFKFNSITHVFDNEYIDDKADLEDLAAYINFSKLDDNSKGLANTYHYVCDR
jgi:hypothetical protein